MIFDWLEDVRFPGVLKCLTTSNHLHSQDLVHIAVQDSSKALAYDSVCFSCAAPIGGYKIKWKISSHQAAQHGNLSSYQIFGGETAE